MIDTSEVRRLVALQRAFDLSVDVDLTERQIYALAFYRWVFVESAQTKAHLEKVPSGPSSVVRSVNSR